MLRRHGAPPRLPAVAPRRKHHAAAIQQREAAGSQQPQRVFLRGFFVLFEAFLEKGWAPTEAGILLMASLSLATASESFPGRWLLHETKESGFSEVAVSLEL